MGSNKLTKIAIVGRPNVGKSSLFNRILGERKAIVESASGTTRDRLYADIGWKGKRFTIVDTGGFEAGRPGDISELIIKQLEAAIKESDIIFFVTDGIAGILPQDTELSARLRKASKKIFLVVNKVDHESKAGVALDFFELGLGEPYAVSAAHDIGIERLLDDAVKCIGKQDAAEGAEPVKVAIVGRPNVGKSSYLNAILMEDRVIVHPTAGTTRDAVDIDFKYKDRNYIFIDTAGMRHNAKINRPVDFYGGVRSKEAVKRCDVAVVLIDGLDGLREDDTRIIDLCFEDGKPLIIAVNKWDLVKNIEMARYREALINKMNSIKNFPVIFMSCVTKRNVAASLDSIWPIYEKSKTIFPTDELIVILKALNDAPEVRNKRIKFIFLAQEGAMPPRFTLGIRNIRLVNENLKRYVENFLRKARDFEGTPIKINFVPHK